MISGIKIYDGNGVLKTEISPEKAKKIYNQNNRSNWCLSPTERQWWKGLKLDDPLPKKQHTPRWLSKKYKKQIPTYQIKCVICKTEVMKASKEAKYCGANCYGVDRRKKSNQRYQKKKYK